MDSEIDAGSDLVQLDLFKDTVAHHPWHHRHSDEMRARVLSAVAVASAAEVGRKLGLNRARVLGIVHRARQAGVAVETQHRARRSLPDTLPAYVPPPRIEPTPRPATTGTPMPTTFEVEPVVAAVPAATGYGPVSLLHAGPRHCRAVDGDADDGIDVLCCGLDTGGPGPWCPQHRALYCRPGRLHPIDWS